MVGKHPQTTFKLTLKNLSKCIRICIGGTSMKPCAKIVQVKVYPNDQPEKAIKTCCIIDHQNNRSLADHSSLISSVNKIGNTIHLVVMFRHTPYFRQTIIELHIGSLDGQTVLYLPTLIECNEIPDNKDEIPTAEVARCYSHLQDIAHLTPPINFNEKTLLLLGRDIISVHNVQYQRIGNSVSPFGQNISFGWVVVGETCIERAHKSSQVNVNKTCILHDGQPSLTLRASTIFMLERVTLMFCSVNQTAIFSSKQRTTTNKGNQLKTCEFLL